MNVCCALLDVDSSVSDAVGISTTGDSGPPASTTNRLIVSAVSPPPSTTREPVAGPTLGGSPAQSQKQRNNQTRDHEILRLQVHQRGAPALKLTSVARSLKRGGRETRTSGKRKQPARASGPAFSAADPRGSPACLTRPFLARYDSSTSQDAGGRPGSLPRSANRESGANPERPRRGDRALTGVTPLVAIVGPSEIRAAR